MVLERYLTDILTSQFGHFVEGLDKNQVRLSALWKGQVSLQNVRLRRHALDHLVDNNPFEIAHGHVGTLQLHIPWQVVLQLWQGSNNDKADTPKKSNAVTKKKKIGSVSVVLKDVHVLIIPRRKRARETTAKDQNGKEKRDKNTAESEQGEEDSGDGKDPWTTKEQQVQAALDAELLRMAAATSMANTATNTVTTKQQTSSPPKKKSSSAWQFWLQERLAGILENLTVTVQNIHVRYEDPGSCLGFAWDSSKKYRPSFSVGLTLQQFTIHSIQQPESDTTDSTTRTEEKEEENAEPSSSHKKTQSTTSAPHLPGFFTRYKRAAATDLAVYWNSGARIMSELKEETEEGTSFYQQAFLAFRNRTVADSELSEAARIGLFGFFGSDENTYVLSPFSPSITFAMVRSNSSSHHAAATSASPPPSTIEARLPSCRITLSRNLIEDLGYIRKSFAIWAQSRQYEQFQAILQTRPTVSPLESPAAWWKYALSAVLVAQRTEEEQTQKDPKRAVLRRGKSDSTTATSATTSAIVSWPPPPHCRHGWHALAKAILARGRYVRFYKQFIEDNKDEYCHEQLLQMECEQLTTEEIVAFRIHAARQISIDVPFSLLQQEQGLLKRKDSQQGLLQRKDSQQDAGGPDDTSVVSALTTETPFGAGLTSKESGVEESAVLTSDHRYRMFIEMKEALAEGGDVILGRTISGNDEDDESSNTTTTTTATNTTTPHRIALGRPFGLDNSKNRISWTMHISCPEVSLQVNDKRIRRRHRDLPAPVVRLQLAFLQEQRLFLDGSWELAISVGSLHVEDCTAGAKKNPFPNLLGPKKTETSSSSDMFYLDGIAHLRSASLRIRRSQRGYRTNEFGSTTWTEVRVLPLEICYATSPVEALVRILNTANLDFANDYQRLGDQISEWRERQKKRLLAALSHKEKSIFVQVSVGSPTLLLPDEGNLLIVDFGQLTFCNDDSAKKQTDAQYDDHWRFELASIQVQCASVEKYKSLSPKESSHSLMSDDERHHNLSQPKDTLQQLIEPFSLNFSISTKFRDNNGDRTDDIHVRASLPRLAFNITTSAIRLVLRLRDQWNERQLEIRSSLLLPSRVLDGLAGKTPGAAAYKRPGTRNIEFKYVAPLLRFRCENDVDGRDCNSSNMNTTPLIDLALRGIEGCWKSSMLPSGLTEVVSEAKLRGVDCVDLYQGAGEEFSLLLSSIAPESISYDHSNDRYLNSTDLVIVNFESSSSGNRPEAHNASRLKIQFFELFIEWNAETIAAVNRAFKHPFQEEQKELDNESQNSDTFFDAEEEDFHDAGSVLSGKIDEPDDTFNLSEIDSTRSSFANLLDLDRSELPLSLGGGVIFAGGPLSPTHPLISRLTVSQRAPSPTPQPPQARPLEIVFDLSKLRVNFNKESRHRRVVSAEMDRTSVVYSLRPTGGYVAKVTLGNFILSDADSVDNKTLYREIVGLKTDAPLDRGKPASLLEMSIVKNPRSRGLVSGDLSGHHPGEGNDESVTVDVSNACVRGCDIFFSAQFSPMRFVYLQQLWFEVIDYFFEGITGFEVWGNRRPTPVPESELRFAPSNADQVSFTRFEVVLEAPVILVPVSYCSTDFLRVEADRMTVGNRYDFRPMRTENPVPESSSSKQQWFNNCAIKVGNMTLSSWSGRRLNSTDDKFTALVDMNWPSGPSAILNKPKWKVTCHLGQTHVSLLREDYALIQHIVAQNFSEGSRHWDEWDALQNLPPLVLERYKEDIMVHFGYDKKDVTPTTFDVLLILPCLGVSLLNFDRSETALVRCFDFTWSYWKHSDFISRQKMVCHIDMTRRGGALLSGQNLSLNGGKCEGNRPSLGYQSISRPFGDVERSLDMAQALIHVGYGAWAAVSDFFRDLPSPSYISPENVIQVGDRWYAIGNKTTMSEKPKANHRNLSWISAKKSRNDAPSQQLNQGGTTRSSLFRVALRQPQIAFKSGDSALVLGMETVEYVSLEKHSKIEKDFRTTNMKLTASDRKRGEEIAPLSPLQFASVCAKIRQCSAGEHCSCPSHSTIVEVGAIESSLLYSDLNIACEVVLEMSREIRLIEQKSRNLRSDSKSADGRKIVVPPVESILQLRCTSVHAVISDDSKRHFPSSRELLEISLYSIELHRTQARPVHSVSNSSHQSDEAMLFSLQRVCFVDCLQHEDSQLRSVLTVSPREGFLSTFPLSETMGEASQMKVPCAIVLRRAMDADESRYTIDIHHIGFQYNPSMVLALQRLMGRLRKRFLTAYNCFPPVRSGSSPESRALSIDPYREVKVSATLRNFSLHLNKEHQERRLVQILLENCNIKGHRSKALFEVSTTIEDFKVLDSDASQKTKLSDRNKSLVKVSDMCGPFLKLKYVSFLGAEDARSIPVWGSSFVHDEKVDDILDLSLASLDLVFLSQRTLELLDYFKNALPGKDMGGTGTTAPVVVKKSTKTSCFNFRTDGVSLYIPKNRTEDSGLVILCDLLVRSWGRRDPALDLEGSITDFCCKVYGENGAGLEGRKLIENIEVLIQQKKSASGHTDFKCGLSDVQARLCYTDYALLMGVLRENIGRPVDKSEWDQLDFCSDAEDAECESNEVQNGSLSSSQHSKDFKSGPGARSIQCGDKAPAKQVDSQSSLNFTFAVSDAAIIFRRNDDVSHVDYDMVLFRGEQFDFVLTRTSEAETAVFSVKQIFAFDLGGQGRVLRSNQSYSMMEVGPMPIPVLMEGYRSAEKAVGTPENCEDTLIMAHLEKPKGEPESTRISIVVSRLSLAVLFRPLQEFTDFMSQSWSQKQDGRVLECHEAKENKTEGENSKVVSERRSSRSVALRLVLHYPRIMIVADEGDPHSRALILRGLALVNASSADTELAETGEMSRDENERESLVTVNGDFQGISSYIIPDVAGVLFAKDSYRMFIEDVLLETSPFMFFEDNDKDGNPEEPGMSLLLPVTVGVEFEQRSKNSIAYQRSVALNMDPVSLMISAEDLQLIRLLAKKWSSGNLGTKEPGQNYDIVFHSPRLGLGLRKVGEKIIVDAIHQQPIGIGDVLVGINGEDLNLTESTPLSDIVERLRNEPRPLKLTFRVKDATGKVALVSHFDEARSERKDGYKDSADISLAEASLTLIGNDVPILRATISTTRLNLGRNDGKALERHLSFSSVVTVDYYNLRIWGWEPFMEASNFKLLADMIDPLEGSKTLTLEASDGVSTPMSFNVTDAFATAVRKLSKWDTTPEYETIDGTLFVEEAKKAANAALRFAKQQKNNGSKPFLLQNRSGISCAFVIQKKTSPSEGGNSHNRRSSFVTIGDYSGLQLYDPADVSEVPSGGECKFRLDRGVGSRQKDGQGRVPCLTVAFQSVSGVTLEALVDLQIVRSGVTLLPMVCRSDSGSDHTPHKIVWVSWTVDPRDEMTVLVLSSTFRIVSLLHTQLELGLMPNGSGSPIRSLGILPSNQDFHLPLWLCLQSSFELSIRPLGGLEFSPLFAFEERLGASDEYQEIKYVQCQSRDGDSTWLAASKTGDSVTQSITIDCVLTLLNMLPVEVDWEVSKSPDRSEAPIDGSTLKGKRSGPLGPGESSEILGADDLDIYVRVKGLEWSPWLSLKARKRRAEYVRVIPLTDMFGVPFHIGARVAKKTVGFRVTLFAELWFLNTTSLDIAFGVSAEYMKGPDAGSQDDGQDDFSAAEAALKEISSLFETGDTGKNIRNQHERRGRRTDMLLLPSNNGAVIVEECFEYIEVERSRVVRRWWASSDPLSAVPNLTLIEDDGDGWSWIDPSWLVDYTGGTSDGWETAPRIFLFSPKRQFNGSHQYRRRRWYRRRQGSKKSVNAFFQRPHGHDLDSEDDEKEKKERKRNSLQLGIQVSGGEWSLLSQIPVEGVLYGAIRATSSRWKDASSQAHSTYELCYNVSPLDGEWGDTSRLMTLSSRFIVRNDSKNLIFEVKQAGADDTSASIVGCGGTVPFHWVNHHLPELICIRPFAEKNGLPYYRWSGGFDPLLIGVIPLRIRKFSETGDSSSGSYDTRIRSIKLESKIRPGTGRTGINLSLEEEDERGDGCLFRIDNCSFFPVWVSQDGILVNPSQRDSNEGVGAGDYLPPNQKISFGLDVPFRQGKYKHRKAASLEELLRVRIGLGPLHSRSGIESIRVVSLSAIGSTVRLNPGKLPALDQSHREALQQIRVVGVVTNDGPTRVLRLVMMRKEESLFSIPFHDDNSVGGSLRSSVKRDLADAAIIEGAEKAIQTYETSGGGAFPLQDDALRMAMNAFTVNYGNKTIADKPDRVISNGNEGEESNKGVLISLRMSFNGFIFSLVDSSPGEIAVVTLKNLNALASWNTNRTLDSTVYVTVAHFQVDNMLPNSPYAVAVSPDENKEDEDSGTENNRGTPPLLVLGFSFGPRHKSGVTILKSVTVAPRNLAIRVDLAFLVRLQKYVLDLRRHFSTEGGKDEVLSFPDLKKVEEGLQEAALSGVNSQRIYFGGLTILPCTIKLSVAPARALSQQQAMLEGEESAAIHRAVRKGDVRLGDSEALLGVKIGSRNATPLAVMRGVVKSIVVDALLRLDGASLTFAGVSLQNHIATSQQLGSILTAHYLASLRQNVPALVGSMSALGNPVGLVRGLGDGVSDFVLEPVKGFQRSVQEMDASYLVDGVARGTLSLARHTVGGFADSAAALAETFSKNMAVLTLDRRYAQKRDRGENLREVNDLNVAVGLGSGFQKLAQGFVEGVAGVVQAPIRGAEKKGFEGFAKGIGKGLLGLLVKPIIGISDGITDVMIGVKGAMDGAVNLPVLTQIRPRRALYGRERAIRPYSMADAAACALMMRTRLAGELYMNHVDMGDRVALFSVRRMLMLGPRGQELLVLKYKHIESLEIRSIALADGAPGWGIIIILNTPRRNGSEVEVINCKEKPVANEMRSHLESGMRLVSSDLEIQAETGELNPPDLTATRDSRDW